MHKVNNLGVGYDKIFKSNVKLSEISKEEGLMHGDAQKENQGNSAEMDVIKLNNPCDELRKAREERRWSKRLQRQVDDKVAIPELTEGQSKTAEGNFTTQNSFSVLNENDIIVRSNNMGVKIADNDFASINLLSELEKARALLHMKRSVHDTMTAHAEPSNVSDDGSMVGTIDDAQEEQSDFDDFVLVSPKRLRKPNKKFGCSVSNRKKNSKHNRENICKSKGGGSQGIPAASRKTLTAKPKKKNPS